MKKLLYALLLLPLGGNAQAALNVFSCEPEWAGLTQQLAGDQASIYTATGALQDPHRVEARPSLIAKARRADLVVCTGAELEVGWLPVVLRESGNRAVQPGGSGYFEAAQSVRMLEVPAKLDRAEGDVHALGNPHIQTDARNILAVAAPLAQRLKALDPANGPAYDARFQDFSRRWTAALQRWQAKAAPLRGVPIAVQHKNWAYLLDWLGLREIVALEPKPGVPPTSGYLAEVVATVQRQPVRMVIRAAYEDDRPSAFLAERAHVPAVELPFTIGGTPAATDLFSLYDDTIDRLLAALGHDARRS
jgi:zinc/manganese transport system substrate-binding protein